MRIGMLGALLLVSTMGMASAFADDSKSTDKKAVAEQKAADHKAAIVERNKSLFEFRKKQREANWAFEDEKLKADREFQDASIKARRDAQRKTEDDVAGTTDPKAMSEARQHYSAALNEWNMKSQDHQKEWQKRALEFRQKSDAETREFMKQQLPAH